MKLNVKALVIALACPLITHPATGQRNLQEVPFTLTQIALDLRVDYGRRSINGTQALHLRAVSGRVAVAVPLLLNRLMRVTRVTDEAGHDFHVSQEVVVFQDDSMRQVNAVVVTIGRRVPAGDSVTVVVHYGGPLVGYTETGSLYIQDNVSHDFTIIREDAYAFPVLGLPSWDANRSIVREPFSATARVTVPADLVVATGGRLIEKTKRDSVATWAYESAGPVPFLNIVIAPYLTLDSGGARIFYFRQDSLGARMFAHAVAGAIEHYAAWYGGLGQDLHLAIMEIPEGWGSQASLTAGIIETADAFRDRAQLYQVYHELSHLWNPPDLDRPSPRWNEGLAMFLQWRVAAELDEWNGWEATLERLERSLMRRCEGREACATVPFMDYGKSGATDLSYPVGEIMFYALYHTLGPAAFDRAYREFFTRHRTSGATSGDLVAAFTHADPRSRRILDDWFSTTRWYTLLTTTSMRQVVDGYASR